MPFELFFPLLVYYFAQVTDKEIGGEYGLDLNWSGISQIIDQSKTIRLSHSQLESLLYSFKNGVMDKRRPFRILSYYAKNYYPMMKKLKNRFPHAFKQDQDDEIQLIGGMNAFPD